MLLKLKIAVAKPHAPVNQFWSIIITYVRARRQRARDRRILGHMNDHNLRDIGLNRPRKRGPNALWP
jgi:uncharacterized protein YjiS (DUF1127 family)